MDLDIVPWIRGQDETGAVFLARSLCMAEAWRHEISLSAVSISGRVKAPDQGIDGRTEFPLDLKSFFPLGHMDLQVLASVMGSRLAIEVPRILQFIELSLHRRVAPRKLLDREVIGLIVG